MKRTRRSRLQIRDRIELTSLVIRKRLASLNWRASGRASLLERGRRVCDLGHVMYKEALIRRKLARGKEQG